MGKAAMHFQIKNLKNLTARMEQIHQKGEKAMQRTIGDMKTRLPGPIASQVSKFYSIDKAEINPASKNADPKKTAAHIGVKGNTVANLSLVYKGRVLTPYGHGFKLDMQPLKDGRSKIRIKVKKKTQTLKGAHNTVFLAPVRKGSSKKIPFQRIVQTNAIEVIRTVSVPQMIRQPQTQAAIYERIHEIVNKRVRNHFKQILR